MMTAQEKHLRRRARLKAAGLCVECGKAPPRDGLASCGTCRPDRQEQKARRPPPRPRANKECIRCFEDAAPGSDLCAEHIATLAQLRAEEQRVYGAELQASRERRQRKEYELTRHMIRVTKGGGR